MPGRAEVHEVDAIVLALAGIDEAEQAILEAVVARMDADIVQRKVGQETGPTGDRGSRLLGGNLLFD